jgi:UDPglucose 6-dehydrogenase
LTGKKIALYGFAFKKDTGDTRESAAIKLVKTFLLEGGKVDIYDPKVTEQQIWHELVSPETTRETRKPQM